MGYEINVRLNSGVECRQCYNWNTLHPLHSGGSRIYRRGVQDCNARNPRTRKILGATPTFDKPRPQNAFRKYRGHVAT